MARYGAKIAKHQPRKPESCDGCVGQLIQWGMPEWMVTEAIQDRRRHGRGEGEVLLVNYLLPGAGTVQTTLCRPCRKEVLDLD